MDIIEFHSFSIEDKAYISGFFNEHHYEQCDCSFNTLFLWQHAYSTMWAVEENILFVRAGRGEDIYFLPPFAGEMASFLRGLDMIREELRRLGKPFLLMGASPWVIGQMEKHCPGRYVFEEARDDWEYIYNTADLMALSGKKYRMKKNHLNGFLRAYGDYVYESIGVGNRKEAQEGIAEWFRRHGDIEKEEEALARCFANWEALGMRGGLIRIYGKVEAFTCGDFLNPQMAHIPFEKANPDIRGLYQVINRDFLVHEFGDTLFVNREEDLGIPGLRQAKLEYHPVRFAEKYTVREA